MKSNLKINFIRLTKFLLTVIVSINFNQQNKRKREKFPFFLYMNKPKTIKFLNHATFSSIS